MEHRKITPHGRSIHALPCHPRIAHMLLMAKSDGSAALAADVAALLEERDPLGREAGVDCNLRIEALHRHRVKGSRDRRWDNIEKIARSYRKLLGVPEGNGLVDPCVVGLLIAYAYPERIAKSRNDGKGTYQLANGKRAVVPTGDDLVPEGWIAIAMLDAREGVGKVFLAAPVDPNDLDSFIQETERVAWDSQKGVVAATRDRRIGNIVLESAPLSNPDGQSLLEALFGAIRAEGRQLLVFDDEVANWQHRVLSLRHWQPEGGWPDVSTTALIQSPERWLTPYLDGIRKAEELRKLDLVNILSHSLSYDQQQVLGRLAPTGIGVPSGSRIPLRYSPMGEPPVLAVRLQEVFGLLDTPMVNDGLQPVVLHLLSPGFKPVQVTKDLRSFWQNAYFEVRSELRRRYPKHAWPEDPLKAEAVRGAPRRK